MNQAPQLAGFYLGNHDSNLAVFAKGRVRYHKFERSTGEKHRHATLLEVAAVCRRWGVEPAYIAYSDGDRNGLGSCAEGELAHERKSLGISLFPAAKQTFCLDHHFAHILSAWPCGELQPGTLGVAVDGKGDRGVRARAVWLGAGGAAESLFETGTFTLGRFFNQVGARLGLSGLVIDFAGKLMGLQAYGTADPDFVRRRHEDPSEELPGRLMDGIAWRGRTPREHKAMFTPGNPDFLDWLATCHQCLGEALVRLFERYGGAPDTPLVYAGGCAQNSVFNEMLAARFPRLVIPPHSYDGGLSLGCLEYLRLRLGLAPLPLADFPFVQDDEDAGYASPATVSAVCDLLVKGRIVGWMQGNGEIGPRALGHRSLLMDPRQADAKDRLNGRVKFREHWRPFAGSVLAETAAEWFTTETPSPYMLRAIPVRPERRHAIPAVVHRDGTSRIQTVDAAAPGLASFHRLLVEFGEATGVPMLLNTSLNSGGQPIYGTRAQALELFRSGRIDALCLGDELYVHR